MVVLKTLFIGKSLRPLRASTCYLGVRIFLEEIRPGPYWHICQCHSQAMVHQILEFHAQNQCASNEWEWEWEYWMNSHGQLIPSKSVSNSNLSFHLPSTIANSMCFYSVPKSQLTFTTCFYHFQCIMIKIIDFPVLFSNSI